MLRILTSFDGSSPRDDVGVRQIDEATFIVFPNYRRQEGIEEECLAGSGARFSTRIQNTAATAQKVTVVADWQTELYVQYRDLGFVRMPGEVDWRQIPGRHEKTQVTYDLTVPPGITSLALYPEYNYTDCCQFVERHRSAGVEVQSIGKSQEGRDLWMLHLPSPNPRAKRFVVQARDHAYESAGSFCVEGIMDMLLSGSEQSRLLRREYGVYVIPMANPDGVHNGMSRLTSERGANLNRLITRADGAHLAVRNALDRVRPNVYLNIHNWQVKDIDGLLVIEPAMAAAIMSRMPDDVAHGKKWFVESRQDWLKSQNLTDVPETSKSWKDYCLDHFGAIGVTAEFPWPGRTPADMRRTGASFLAALGFSALETGGSV